MTAFFLRFALGFALAASLAGCGEDQQASLAQDPDAAVINQFVSRGQTLSAPITAVTSPAPSLSVLTLPPEAMRGGKLTEKQYANGWRQSVPLETRRLGGDWSDLSIEMASNVPTDAGTTYKPNVLRLTKPTAEGVRHEILARFKGVPMRIVGRPMGNALGPYGLAVGAGPGGLRCAYAWQWLNNLAAAARGEKGTFFNNEEMPASIRMRLCRTGVTADQLAEWYSGLQIANPENVARIAESIRRNADVTVASGGASPVISSSSDSLEATLVTAPQASAGGGGARAPRRSAAHRRPATPSTPSSEAPSFVPPSGAPVPLTTPSSPSADGRQFLAPTTNGGALSGGQGVVYNAPKPDPSLPAQAYRGPAGARAVTAPPSGGAPIYLGPKVN